MSTKYKATDTELNYRSLFEAMDQGFCVLDMIFDAKNQPVDYRFVEINPVFEQQTGLKNAVGKTALELVPSLERHWINLYGKVALSGEPARFIEESQAMDRWFDVYAFRIGGRDSRKVALLFTDITFRKRAEDSIRRSEQNLRNIIAQAPVAMCILIGPQHVISTANEAMIRLWGKNSSEVFNKPVFEALPDAKAQGLEHLLQKVYETGETFKASERPVQLLRSGVWETVYQNFVYEAYRDAENTIIGIMVVSVEVTEQVLARQRTEDLVQKRTEELGVANEELHKINLALQKNNEELFRSNDKLQEFAYVASHDLKEPVRKIQTFGERLEKSLVNKLSDENRNFLDKLMNSARRMGILIDDLLAYSQFSLEPFEAEQVDLNEVCTAVLSELDLEIELKKATVKIERLCTVSGNFRQLQRVFQNLLTNALKYSSPQRTPQITIAGSVVTGTTADIQHIISRPATAYCKIEVKDNGIGFEAKDAENIFTLFTRLSSTTQSKGTGIGLSIVQKIIENHKGIVLAAGWPDEGAIFTIYLPL